jgi:hypothetical protein
MALKRITLDQFSKGIISHYGKSILTRNEVNSYASMIGVSRPDGWDSNPFYKNSSSKNASGYKFSNVSAAKTNRKKIDVNSLDQDKETEEVFEDLDMLTEVVTKKKVNSLIVTGNAGIGKTHGVISKLEKSGLQKERDYIVLKSKISPLGLYLTLFLHHDKVIVFDDLDDLFKNDDCSAILKACLDSYDVREVSWSSKKMVNVVGVDDDTRRRIEDEARSSLLEGETDVALPNRFQFKGQIIFISNLSQEKFDKAVMSRSVCIDMTLTDKQVFSRMKAVVTKLKNKRTAEMAFATIVKKYNDGVLELPNLRTVLNYANVVESGVKNAERLSKYC